MVVLASACSSSDTTATSASSTTARPTTTSSPAVASTTTLATDRTAPDPSPGCASADKGTTTPGKTTVRMKVGDLDRWSYQYVPKGTRAGQPLPLVIDLHGYGQGPELQIARTRFDEAGDVHGFVTLTPNGRYDPIMWDPHPDSPDVTFIGALLDRTEADLCIDENRVYVAGFSNGAFMVSTLACTMPDRLAAIAGASGLRAVPGCTDPRPLPVIAFHGTADTYVEYDGGFGAPVKALVNPVNPKLTLGNTPDADLPNAVPGTSAQSAPAVMAAWGKRNGCKDTPREAKFVPDVTQISFDCPNDQSVVLYRTTGGQHHWPGSKGSIEYDRSLGHADRTIDATALTWDFFQAHARHQH